MIFQVGRSIIYTPSQDTTQPAGAVGEDIQKKLKEKVSEYSLWTDVSFAEAKKR